MSRARENDDSPNDSSDDNSVKHRIDNYTTKGKCFLRFMISSATYLSLFIKNANVNNVCHRNLRHFYTTPKALN